MVSPIPFLVAHHYYSKNGKKNLKNYFNDDHKYDSPRDPKDLNSLIGTNFDLIEYNDNGNEQEIKYVTLINATKQHNDIYLTFEKNGGIHHNTYTIKKSDIKSGFTGEGYYSFNSYDLKESYDIDNQIDEILKLAGVK